MKLRIYMTLWVCFLVIGGIQAQASLKFNETFPSNNAVKINLDVENDKIEVKTIKGSRIVVETMITISSPNDRLLEFIAEGGRYKLEHHFDEGKNEMNLVSKKNKDIITIKGKEIEEHFTYTIYVPESTKYVNETLASR